VALLIGGVIYLYAHHVWKPLPNGLTIDRISVEKSERRLSVWKEGRKLKSYHVALGRNPTGA
jgi:hypothetical protein